MFYLKLTNKVERGKTNDDCFFLLLPAIKYECKILHAYPMYIIF